MMHTLSSCAVRISFGLPDHPTHSIALRSPVKGPRILILAAVIVAHAGGLWALHSGLQSRVREIVTPIAWIAEVVDPMQAPAPTPASVPASPSESARAASAPAAQRTDPHTPPGRQAKPAPQAPRPLTAPSNIQPSTQPLQPTLPVAASAEATAAAPEAEAAVSTRASGAAPSPSAEPAEPPKNSKAGSATGAGGNAPPSYCGNKKPAYPTLSSRLGEQGLVLVRAWVERDGSVANTELLTSSGFERLDKAAISAIRSWRFKPGLVEGVPTAMWIHVPMRFGQTSGPPQNNSQMTCE